jgi:hypothetical protein
MIEIKLDKAIRENLDRIAFEYGAENFAYHLPKDIEIINPSIKDCDCEEWALGTFRIKEYLPDFFREVPAEEANFILYLSGKEGVMHIGIIQDGSVFSKWGINGPVLKHPRELVPSHYGNYMLFQYIPDYKCKTLRQPNFIESVQGFLDTYY